MHRKNNGNRRNDFLNIELGRRALLKSSLLGGGAAVASAMFGGLIPVEALGTDASSKYVGPAVDTTSGKVRGVIQGELAQGRLRTDIDVKYLALSLLNLLNWTIFWYQPGGSLEPEQLADILATIFIEGAGAPRAVPS